MSRRLTVDDLINDVRSVLDEDNKAHVTDEGDILPALNRAQDYAANILSRHYESPMIVSAMLPMVSGQQEYDLPHDAFEQRLEKVEVKVIQVYYPVKALSYRDITLYETPTRTNVPFYYAIIGSKFRVFPSPTATYPLRLWYLKDPDPLVTPQGMITLINAASNYIIVDSIGPDVSVSSDNLDSYVNLVDGQTGVIKASMQIQSINGNKITFKSIPTRTTVLGKTIVGAIPTDPTVSPGAINQDDYICTINGTCIPLFKKPFSNFLIQYAVAEIRRKLGGPAELEITVLKDLEAQVQHSWVGREQSLRVHKSSKNWAIPTRRYFNST